MSDAVWCFEMRTHTHTHTRHQTDTAIRWIYTNRLHSIEMRCDTNKTVPFELKNRCILSLLLLCCLSSYTHTQTSNKTSEWVSECRKEWVWVPCKFIALTLVTAILLSTNLYIFAYRERDASTHEHTCAQAFKVHFYCTHIVLNIVSLNERMNDLIKCFSSISILLKLETNTHISHTHSYVGLCAFAFVLKRQTEKD